MDPYIKRKILKKHGTSFEEGEDYIAVENKLKIFINGKEIVSLYCTPSMVKELVIGFFLTEGIFANKIPLDKINISYGEDFIADISVDEDILKGKLLLSRCLGGFTSNKNKSFKKIIDDFSIAAESLKTIFNEFHQKSELFKLTGCFHSAALSDGERILVFADDIGRHNVIDKIIGHAFMNDITLGKKLMLVSCRLSSEIVSKCSSFGISIIASRAAPTSLAIEIAEKSGSTLVGFVRGDRMNIYTNPQRIIT